MTTGNAPALPADTSQPAPAVTDAAVAAVAADGAAPAADGGLTFTHPQPVDVDDVELTNAKTAAQAENTAGDGEGKTDATTGKEPAQPAAATAPTDPAAKPQQPAGGPVMIPKQRLDEELGKRSEAERKAAYWQGVAEARAQQPGQPGAAPAQPQQPTPEQRLAQIHTAQDALATKFDNGEITMADYKKQERELNAQEAGLREEALTTKLRPTAPAAPAQGNDELYLETLTAKLEGDHPWVVVADKAGTDQDWGYIKGKAIENLTARGIDPTQGNVGRYELRKEIAQLWDKFGPTLVGDKATALGITLPGATTQGNQQQKQPLSLQAQAREAGLRKAAGAPPDLNAMNGHTGDLNGQPSESRLETMTDEEIGALPVSARNKLLGISA